MFQPLDIRIASAIDAIAKHERLFARSRGFGGNGGTSIKWGKYTPPQLLPG